MGADLIKILISVFYIGLTFSEASKPKNIEVIIGQDLIKKLNFSPSTKVQIGNDGILNYEIIPSKKEITFKGLKAGKTTANIRDRSGEVRATYNITITLHGKSNTVKELKEFLGDIEGLEIGIKGEHVYVGGRIVVPSDIGRVVVILEKFPDVIRLVELSQQTQRVIAKKMQAEIHKSGIADVSVRVVNGMFWLEGVVSSNGQKSRAELISTAYIPDRIESLAKRTDSVQSVKRQIIQNFISVNAQSKPAPVPKQVRITVQFVELTKDYMKAFGFKWAPVLAEGGTSISFGKTVSGGIKTKGNNTLSGTISNLFPKLASAKNAGFARIIQQGQILTKNGIAGKLSKTLEQPYAIGTGEFIKSEKATAGLDITVTPKILSQEKIDLSMGVKVSSVLGDPPKTASNNISTNVIVKNKDTAVIGGVVTTKTSTDFDRTPPYGIDKIKNGTPLFSFLRSKSYTSSKSQFAVFVTPEIIEDASEGADKVIKLFRKRRR